MYDEGGDTTVYSVTDSSVSISMCNVADIRYSIENDIGTVHNYEELLNRLDLSLLSEVTLRCYYYNEKIVVPVSLLNRMTAVKTLVLYGLYIKVDSRLNLQELECIVVSKCRLSKGTTYDLLSDLNDGSPLISTISISSMYGERRTSCPCKGHVELKDVLYSSRVLPITKMTRLYILKIYYCLLNAAFPKDMSSLQRLYSIDIHNSHLTGVIPQSLADTPIQSLIIHDNGTLDISVPTELQSISMLSKDRFGL